MVIGKYSDLLPVVLFKEQFSKSQTSQSVKLFVLSRSAPPCGEEHYVITLEWSKALWFVIEAFSGQYPYMINNINYPVIYEPLALSE